HAVVAFVGLEAFENLLRVVQDGCGRIEREIRAGFDARAMPALGLVVADDRHVIGENPAEARIRELCRALLLRSRVRRRLDFEFQTHSLASRCRAPSPAPACLFRACWVNRSGLHHQPCGRPPSPSCRLTTCFCGMPKSSMFAEMPLDNRTVVHLRPLPPLLAFSDCLTRLQV